MSLEIREPRDDELDEVAYIGAYSFHNERTPEALEHRRGLYKVLRPLAAFQNGRAVASLTLLSLPMAVNGGRQPFAGVASVACLPEHRRKGYVGPSPDRRLGHDAPGGPGPLGPVYAPRRPLSTLRLDAGRPPAALQLPPQGHRARRARRAEGRSDAGLPRGVGWPGRHLSRVHRPPKRLPPPQRAVVAAGRVA